MRPSCPVRARRDRPTLKRNLPQPRRAEAGAVSGPPALSPSADLWGGQRVALRIQRDRPSYRQHAWRYAAARRYRGARARGRMDVRSAQHHRAADHRSRDRGAVRAQRAVVGTLPALDSRWDRRADRSSAFLRYSDGRSHGHARHQELGSNCTSIKVTVRRRPICLPEPMHVGAWQGTRLSMPSA